MTNHQQFNNRKERQPQVLQGGRYWGATLHLSALVQGQATKGMLLTSYKRRDILCPNNLMKSGYVLFLIIH